MQDDWNVNYIDTAILIIVGVFSLRGFFRGLIVEMLSFIVFVVSIFLIVEEFNTVASWLIKNLHLPPRFSFFLGYLMIFSLMFLFFRWFAGVLRLFTKAGSILWLDKGGGFIFGMAKGFFIVGILSLILNLITISDRIQKEKDRSLLFRSVSSFVPAVFNYINKFFPKSKDILEEIREGFPFAKRK